MATQDAWRTAATAAGAAKCAVRSDSPASEPSDTAITFHLPQAPSHTTRSIPSPQPVQKSAKRRAVEALLQSRHQAGTLSPGGAGLMRVESSGSDLHTLAAAETASDGSDSDVIAAGHTRLRVQGQPAASRLLARHPDVELSLQHHQQRCDKDEGSVHVAPCPPGATCCARPPLPDPATRNPVLPTTSGHAPRVGVGDACPSSEAPLPGVAAMAAPDVAAAPRVGTGARGPHWCSFPVAVPHLDWVAVLGDLGRRHAATPLGGEGMAPCHSLGTQPAVMDLGPAHVRSCPPEPVSSSPILTRSSKSPHMFSLMLAHLAASRHPLGECLLVGASADLKRTPAAASQKRQRSIGLRLSASPCAAAKRMASPQQNAARW